MGTRSWFTGLAIGFVLVVGALALADSLRRPPSVSTNAAPATTEAATTGPEVSVTVENGTGPRPEAPADWPQGLLDGVLTFVGAGDCRIRTIGLAGGRERPPTRFFTDCRGLWAPRVGARLAFGEVLGDGFFRIADLAHPRRDFGAYPIGPHTSPFWSPDGRRIAWCDSPRSGVEREVLARGRVVRFCPLAYTPDGTLARAEGRNLEAGETTLVAASGAIGLAAFGVDGSVALLVDGDRLERYVSGELAYAADVPAGWSGLPIAFSPDTCAAAVPLVGGIAVAELGCSRADAVTVLPGQAAAWSPDGSWLAVAEPDAIAFHRVTGGDDVLRWPARASQLGWRS